MPRGILELAFFVLFCFPKATPLKSPGIFLGYKSLLKALEKLLPSLLENFSSSPLHSSVSILHSSDCSAECLDEKSGSLHLATSVVGSEKERTKLLFFDGWSLKPGFSLVAKSRTLGWPPL